MPRRRLRLARKRVIIGTQEEANNPESLPYYMNAVEEGRAGRWCGRPLYGLEDQEPHG